MNSSPQYFFFSRNDRRPILRHAGNANLLMCDGSAQSANLSRMLRLRVTQNEKFWNDSMTELP